MNLLQKVFNFYLNSSIHVALSVYALSWVTLFEFDLPYDENVLFFIFFGSITGYNFVKYFGLAKFHHRSLTSWLKAVQIFSMLCFIMMCYFALQLHPEVLLIIAILGAITFLYAIPMLPEKVLLDKHKNLRSISGVKVYVIALVWAGVTVFLPLFNEDAHLSYDVLVTVIQRFLFVLVLMFPFEIRDLQYDSLKLATIPQQIGVKRTKIIGVLLLLIFVLLEFLKDELSVKKIITTLIVALITMTLLVFSKKNIGRYYTAFLVEAIPVMWLFLFLLM
ncbi:hypothetical protein [Lacinutrix undariae]